MSTGAALHQTLCPTCGRPVEESDGLCLACLMRCADGSETLELPGDGEQDAEKPRIGSYELLEEIGRGGMGIIYRARQLHTGRIVAMKILQSHIAYNPDLLARFRREAQSAARLDHPNVLPIYEVNDDVSGVPFFTMKLAAGGSLAGRRTALQGRPRDIAAVISKVARAAQHAHDRGVLHRDLKPGNILFDAQGEPMVSDFGLAAWLHEESDLTRSIMVFGTPGYLPPEYVHGRPEVLLPTSDIYSLGVILFELLAGKLPVPAEASLSAIRQAAERPPPLLRASVPGADRDLEVICARCLEADPALRYQSAGEVADDLERWLRGEPIIARPTSPLVRAWKLARRHPAISIAALLCLLLLVVGLVLIGKLANATAYERTVAVLPVEDLDTLTRASPLARDATRLCLDAARSVRGMNVIPADVAPDPLPRHGPLAELSRRLGSRYLLTATVRSREQGKRLVFHLTDAAADRTLQMGTIEYSSAPPSVSEIAAAIAATQIEPRQPALSQPSTDPRDPASDEYSRLAEKYRDAGMQLVETGVPENIDHAVETYERWTRAQPRNAEAKAKLANVMIFRSRAGERTTWVERALRMAREAVIDDPHLPAAHRTLAVVLAARGQYREALDSALTAYECQPDDAFVVSCVADAMENLGALDLAIVWNRKAAAREDASPLLALYRGMYLAEAGAFAAAEAAFAEFLEFKTQPADGHLSMANLHLLKGNATPALEQVRDLHRRFPDHTVVAQNRAAMEFLAGDLVEAERLFREAMANEEFGLLAFLSVRGSSALGCLALERGDPAGRALVERALRLDEERLGNDSQDTCLHFERAANLALLGRKTEALDSLRKTLPCPRWTYFQIKLDRRFVSLRNESEFGEIVNALERRQEETKTKLENPNPHPTN